MSKKFYVKDCPDGTTIIKWLYEQTDWKKAQNAVNPVNNYNQLLCFTLDNFDAKTLENDIWEATQIYGDHGWISSDGISDYYTGFSLVYNPNHIDNLDPHTSTLGTEKNSLLEGGFFYGNVTNHPVLKNSYFDGYSMNTPTPASKFKSVGTLLDRCRRTRIRSRLSIIHGDTAYDQRRKEEGGWHKDERIFENIRINIPILTNQDYLFEIEGAPPVHLPVGHAYSWDTYVPHRVYANNPSTHKRIHFVLGFSPWWDYEPSEQCWIQNEFYGNKHPFDMLVDGDIFSGLKLDTNKIIL